MQVIGLTGTYGSGKSSALREFHDLGAMTVSADDIVSKLLNEPAILDRVRVILGHKVFHQDGTLDKARVADAIFSDDEKRAQLERLLHPIVFQRIQDMIWSAKGCQVVVVEVPLLFEAGHEGRFKTIVTVWSDLTTSIERLMAKGIDRDDAMRRIERQMPVEEKVKRSHYVIENNGTLDEMKKKVARIYKMLMAECK